MKNTINYYILKLDNQNNFVCPNNNKHNIKENQIDKNIIDIELNTKLLNEQTYNSNEIEDSFSIGSYKAFLIQTCGLICLSFYSLFLVFSISLNSIKKDLSFSNEELGFTFGIVTISGVLGNCICQFIDIYGRIRVLRLLLLFQFIFGMAIVLCSHKIVFIGMFGLQTTLSMGISSVILIQVQENITSTLRQTSVGIMFIFEALGFVTIMVMLYIFNDNWRISYGVIVALSFVLFIASFQLCESFRWLLRKNRFHQAINVINQICYMQNEQFKFILYTQNEYANKENQVIRMDYQENNFEDNLMNKEEIYPTCETLVEPNKSQNANIDSAFDDQNPTGKTFQFLQTTFVCQHSKTYQIQSLLMWSLTNGFLPWLFIIQLPDYQAENKIQTPHDQNVITIYSSFILFILVVTLVSTIHFIDKKALLVLTHILSTSSALLLLHLDVFSSATSKAVVLCIGVSLIHTSGRIIVILLSGLTMETVTSEWRGIMFSIVANTGQVGLVFGNVMYVYWYSQYSLYTLTMNVYVSLLSIGAATACWLFSDSKKNEELPN